jgi:ribose transport system permease protein
MTDTTSRPASRTDTAAATETSSVLVLARPALGRRLLENYALVVLTVAVYLFFSFFPASSAAFPTINNLNVILGSQAVVAMLALAALTPLVAGYFDFSLGAIAALCQVLCAGFMANSGWPLWLAIVVPILIAGAIGAVNGFLITRLHMSPFVTTLGMALLISGISIWYTSGQTIVSGVDPAIREFGSSRFLGLPVVVFVVLAIAAVAWYFMTHTPYGRSLYAIGSNASSARLVGIRVERNVWWTFVVAALIAGGAGIMQLSRLGSATASSGNELLFPALAAVFLGATAITPGFFNVIGTIVGAVFVSISVSGLTLSGASGWAANVFNGVALLAAVALSTYLGRRKRG